MMASSSLAVSQVGRRVFLCFLEGLTLICMNGGLGFLNLAEKLDV